MAIDDEPSHAHPEDDGPYDGEGGEELSQAVPVDQRAPIASFRVESHLGQAAVLMENSSLEMSNSSFVLGVALGRTADWSTVRFLTRASEDRLRKWAELTCQEERERGGGHLMGNATNAQLRHSLNGMELVAAAISFHAPPMLSWTIPSRYMTLAAIVPVDLMRGGRVLWKRHRAPAPGGPVNGAGRDGEWQS